MSRMTSAVTLVGLLMLASAAEAITLGQIDDFQDGLKSNWEEGSASPNPPVNIAMGGPGGANDRHLRDSSTGVFGPGGRMALFNLSQWTGNYTTAGVTKIRMHLANFGNAPLTMRVAVEGPGGTRYASITGHQVTNNGEWVLVDFDLSNMTRVGGTGTLASVLGSVSVLRIIASAQPAWQGDQIVATIGIDNIQAINNQTPVESATWGKVKALYQP